ncbi:MAG TPA: hypothetical protein VM841_06945, partial [Actinomycetota bacterium]|nr:hypothetical protein [Actinomycetota bacterium]
RGHATFDAYGDCVYYPDNVSVAIGAGVVVLDVSDPSNPVKTDYLTARAMRSPGESLRVNRERGLLVANYYAFPPPYTADGGIEPPEIMRALAVYDVSEDCAHPRLLADVILPTQAGHEGCFQPDGMVYYSSAGTITPIDLTDPANPREMTVPWLPADPLPAVFHGCSISDDGTRGYFADAANNQMLIVDTSEVQALIPGAQMRVLGRFSTPSELQQSAIAITFDGAPHVLLFTEAKYPSKVCVPGQPNFGYPRIIDVGDETHPVEVAKIQAEVVLSRNCSQVAADWAPQTRGADRGDAINVGISAVFFGGYDSHYCNVDRPRDPTLLGCGQMGSGMRVYDLRDPHAPIEIAYYNTGTRSLDDPTLDWAWSPPVFRTDLGQIWWSTFAEGFHAAKFRDGVMPLERDTPAIGTTIRSARGA